MEIVQDIVLDIGFEDVINACTIEIRKWKTYVVIMLTTMETFQFVEKILGYWKLCFPYEKPVFTLNKKGSHQYLFIEYTPKERTRHDYCHFIFDDASMELRQWTRTLKKHFQNNNPQLQYNGHVPKNLLKEIKEDWREKRLLESRLRQWSEDPFEKFQNMVIDNHSLCRVKCVPNEMQQKGYDSFWFTILCIDQDNMDAWVEKVQSFFHLENVQNKSFQSETVFLSCNNIPSFSFQWIVPIVQPCDARNIYAWAEHYEKSLYQYLYDVQVVHESPLSENTTFWHEKNNNCILWNGKYHRSKKVKDRFVVSKDGYETCFESLCCSKVPLLSSDDIHRSFKEHIQTEQEEKGSFVYMDMGLCIYQKKNNQNDIDIVNTFITTFETQFLKSDFEGGYLDDYIYLLFPWQESMQTFTHF